MVFTNIHVYGLSDKPRLINYILKSDGYFIR